jgi:hypothetical protein
MFGVLYLLLRSLYKYRRQYLNDEKNPKQQNLIGKLNLLLIDLTVYMTLTSD